MKRSLPAPVEDFPVLNQPERPCYLDSAATSLKPEPVVAAVAHFYRYENAPVHRGVYELSARATDRYEQARRTVAAFVGAEEDWLVFTRGTTEALNLVARSWAEEYLKPGDEILISPQEHHSNFLPWREAARRTGATLKLMPILPNGCIDLKETLKLITPRTRIVAMVHVSNVLGIANPVEEVFEAAHRVGALTVLDGAQSVPTRPVNVRELECDFLAFSGHKMLGPTGIGGLVARPELLDQMTPYQTGGGMIQKVSVQETVYSKGVERFEAGTPHAAGAIGLAAACEYLERLGGMEAVAAYEKEWGMRAVEAIRQIPDIHLIGPPRGVEPESGLISLRMEGMHPHDLAVLLDAQGVMCRAGHHCAMPLHELLGTGGASLRASAYVYNTFEDIDRLVDALKFAHQVLHGKLPRSFPTS